MFTFGIFTTHIPYIAMLAFYAYFLLFGVNTPADDKNQVAENTHTVQIQTNDNDAVEINSTNTYSYHCSFLNDIPDNIFEQSVEKQKWKHFGVDRTFPLDYAENALFGRPPPALA